MGLVHSALQAGKGALIGNLQKQAKPLQNTPGANPGPCRDGPRRAPPEAAPEGPRREAAERGFLCFVFLTVLCFVFLMIQLCPNFTKTQEQH